MPSALCDDRSSIAFWLNNVCTNQTDVEGWNTQIELMPAIDSSARQVVVHFGEIQGNSNIVVR
jgi:hypothetical protein